MKHLLYAYRVYLTGIHVLQSAEIECNLDVLNDAQRLPLVADLLARKRGGREKEHLAADEIQAKSFEMAVRYGKELTAPPLMKPSGWAAFLHLYQLR